MINDNSDTELSNESADTKKRKGMIVMQNLKLRSH